MTVVEIVDAIDIGRSTVSQRLKILAEVCVVLAERHGTTSHYRINGRCLTCFPSAADVSATLFGPDVDDLQRLVLGHGAELSHGDHAAASKRVHPSLAKGPPGQRGAFCIVRQLAHILIIADPTGSRMPPGIWRQLRRTSAG